MAFVKKINDQLISCQDGGHGKASCQWQNVDTEIYKEITEKQIINALKPADTFQNGYNKEKRGKFLLGQFSRGVTSYCP